MIFSRKLEFMSSKGLSWLPISSPLNSSLLKRNSSRSSPLKLLRWHADSSASIVGSPWVSMNLLMSSLYRGGEKREDLFGRIFGVLKLRILSVIASILELAHKWRVVSKIKPGENFFKNKRFSVFFSKRSPASKEKVVCGSETGRRKPSNRKNQISEWVRLPWEHFTLRWHGKP